MLRFSRGTFTLFKGQGPQAAVQLVTANFPPGEVFSLLLPNVIAPFSAIIVFFFMYFLSHYRVLLSVKSCYIHRYITLRNILFYFITLVFSEALWCRMIQTQILSEIFTG